MTTFKRLALSALILTLLQGCRSHGDFITTLRVEGIVERDGLGVASATVYFVDTGLDEAGRRERKEHPVGSTDQNGRIAISWSYFWGYTSFGFGRSERDPSEEVPGTFELVVKAGTSSVRRRFRLWSLERRGKEYLVPLQVTLS